MRSRPGICAPSFIESLEPRQLMTAEFGEVEPNRVARDASFVALADGAARLHGTTQWIGDKDYFAFAPAESATIQLSLSTNASSSALRLRFELASGEALATTRSSTQVTVTAGETYYIALLPSRTASVRYTVSLNQTQQRADVDQRRIEVLSRGVNVPHWFWDLRGHDPATTFATYFNDTDAAQLRHLGLRHIRIPLQPKYFFDFNNPTRLRQIHLSALRNAIEIARRNDLGVILAPIGRLQTAGIDPAMREKAVAFYSLLAREFSDVDPSRLFIQLPGEPEGTPYEWQSAQEQLAAAVRRNAPRHTIIATTPLKFGYGENDWGTVDALSRLTPVTTSNVVYGLHFYEPYFFTHQGASWALAGYEYLHDVPYPSSPESAEVAAQRIALETAGTGFEYLADFVRYFGQAQWNADSLIERLNVAFEWSRRWNVPVIVDEFGVYADRGAAAESRDNWIRDVRQAIENAGAGWTMWDFSDDFGLLVGQPDNRWLRFSTAAALGLL